jgi:transposase, IS5 family
MGGLGRADRKPGHYSPNVGGSVSSKRSITEANGEPMPTVARSSISHHKLSSRRVLYGEHLPAAQKLLSLFEEHTQIITRPKMGKPREFGRKVLLDEVDGGIISRYEVLSESGSEHSQLPESLGAHQERFGRAPFLLVGDRGLYSAENEKTAQQAGVKRVVLPKSGRLSEKRKRHEKQRWFRRGYRFRAGIEGRISVLGRVFGLQLCLDHGEEGMERWVGWGILAHNLRQTARRQVARQAA